MWIMFFIVFVPIIIGLIHFCFSEKNNTKDYVLNSQNKQSQEINKKISDYEQKKIEYKIPTTAKSVFMPSVGRYFICKQNNFLILFGDSYVFYNKQKNSIQSIYVIPIDFILYYKIQGEVRYEMQISGGGGGGSSIKGAVVGGLIAGSAGAIIGSRNKINEIKSETVKKDERIVELVYITNKNNENSLSLFFDYNSLSVFSELIPEKSYESYKKNKQQIIEINPTNKDIFLQIEKLAELKNKNILTEEEFLEKKTKLLSQI
ncbi:MAG: SHOCT domain-containing protein [Peptoanaerobacter stomatis]|uniref:SHOCT domain-containing protein n=1 Tax=Peptoanaerobacter stomatis TaxID=796937 RepID=UPI003FA0B765